MTPLYYLPIFTTCLSAGFAGQLFRRYRYRRQAHHLWWGIGVLCYGVGTVTEATITLWGWHPILFRIWYVAGAILGGAPLAQGTVWLLLKPSTARRLTWGLIAYVAFVLPFIFLSPIRWDLVDPHLPSGTVFAWQWIRAFSPFINLYAVVFLIGGALYSAITFYRAYRRGAREQVWLKHRCLGNSLIALGALLPGFGGVASRLGHTEILYLLEATGLVLIWTGYRISLRKNRDWKPNFA
ncbi:MAG: hypothetical protein D6762_08455 [Candidatus Neomarinimicrobiota bacterium]|nr:MAG: hypothetical protein D6762_08455 [Candidatus Neomarinimicrobiota bacterium]